MFIIVVLIFLSFGVQLTKLESMKEVINGKKAAFELLIGIH